MKIRYILCVTVLLAAVMYILLGVCLPGKSEVSKTELSDEWTVVQNRSVTTGVTLSDYKVLKTKKGDTITLVNTLPKNGEEQATLIIGCNYAALNVYIGNTRIYTYGMERKWDGKFVGSGTHYVALPRDYFGKTIKIEMIATENNAIGDLENPILCKTVDAKAIVLRENFPAIAIAITMILDGLCICGATFTFLYKDKRFKLMLCSGFFAFFVGIWALCEYDFTGIINSNYSFICEISHISVFLAAIFVYGYCGVKVLDKVEEKYNNIYKLILLITIVTLVVSVLFHMLDIVHYPTSLKVWHAEMFLMFGYIAYLYVLDRKDKEIRNPVFLTGIGAMLICFLCDVFVYYFSRYTSFNVGHFRGTSCIGTFLMFTCMITEFAWESSKQANMRGKLEQFEQMANNDYLTGLANRRQCEILFDEIDKEQSDYAIIFFDLNNLKEINDTYGHDAGDTALKLFSDVLRSVFSEVSLVARTGGDEFVCIIKHAEILNIKGLLTKLDKKIVEINKANKPLDLCAARGVATKLDNLENVRAAYRLADQRMYENKMNMKRAMKG